MAGESPGSKVDAAIKLETPVLDEESFLELLDKAEKGELLAEATEN